ncbi:hypothetical protein ABT014_11045, partial [Kitasatospora sp. NPDC094015]
YRTNRRTGSFLLIDPADGTTLTAGMAGEAFDTVAAAEPVTVSAEDTSDGSHTAPPPPARHT